VTQKDGEVRRMRDTSGGQRETSTGPGERREKISVISDNLGGKGGGGSVRGFSEGTS